MKDPLELLLQLFPYDPERILAAASGASYVAVMLADGRIGVCSTLHHPAGEDALALEVPDLSLPAHRMLATAYINANVNYDPGIAGKGDIFDAVDFRQAGNVVMVGYFPPLVDKFREAGLAVSIFDSHREPPEVLPPEEMEPSLGRAGTVILTSSSMADGSVARVLAASRPGASILMLGPSTPLHPLFFSEFRISRLFGMQFNPYDFEVLSLIGQGSGTQTFGKLGKKVFLSV